MSLRRLTTFLSRATLDGLLLRLRCRAASLQSYLNALGPLRLAPSSRHSKCLVHVECWQVYDGALLFRDFDQHQWLEQWFAAYGGIRGIPANERFLSWTTRAMEGTYAGWSRQLAASFGHYREILVSVPDVSIVGSRGNARYSLVLGMYTDSPLARFGDVALEFGYRKRLAAIEMRSDGAWIASVAGRRQFALEPIRTGSRRPPAEIDRAHLERCLSQPLVGVLRDGRLRVSNLDRSLASCASYRSIPRPSLESWDASLAAARVTPFGALTRTLDAIAFSRMHARISLPTDLEHPHRST